MELLCVIDYQNDFVNGALGFAEAAALEKGILARVEETLAAGGAVLFTRDTHGDDYLSTREGKFLPVPHCIAGTPGHALYGALAAYEAQPMERVALVDKPTFGSPDLPAAALRLCGGVPDKIGLCGVVTNICVLSNAVVLQTAFANTPVAVYQDLCAALGSGHQEALVSLASLGVELL